MVHPRPLLSRNRRRGSKLRDSPDACADTWVSWFEEAQVAFEAGDDMGPLMSRAQGLVMLTN